MRADDAAAFAWNARPRGRPCRKRRRLVRRPRWALLPIALCGIGAAHAAGSVTELETRETPAAPVSYTVDGTTYDWGAGTNLVLDGFSSNGSRYASGRSAERVEIRRVDLPDVATGTPCAVFAESTGGSTTRLAPDFPAVEGGSGNCDTEALLAGDSLNRGVLDLFSNRPPTAKNIERVDYLFRPALHAPFGADAGALAGHLVGDKSGNNPVQVAAVLALDGAGLPSAFGPLVRVEASGCAEPALCYSVTGLVHDYTFLKSASLAPQGPPTLFSTFVESVGLAYVSAEALGLEAGRRYHGVSLFPEDVDPALHDLLDPSTFPSDTEDEERSPGDSVDVHGGSRRYTDVAVSKVRGRVACAADEEGEAAGLAGIDVSLHVDANGDGALDPDDDSPIGDPVASDDDGAFELVGLSDGSYFLVLGESDADLPGDVALAPVGPRAFVVAGAGVESLDFALDCASNGPTANADSVEILQGAPGAPLATTRVEVLANDTDPLGRGLTVVATDGATQGTVTVTDEAEAVLYAPAVDARGQDSFDYTVEDDAGRRSSATVTVSFTLLSDDPTCFDGAPSDACALRTEVDGHGLGSPWWPALAVVLATFVGRRRAGRRHALAGGRP